MGLTWVPRIIFPLNMLNHTGQVLSIIVKNTNSDVWSGGYKGGTHLTQSKSSSSVSELSPFPSSAPLSHSVAVPQYLSSSKDLPTAVHSARTAPSIFGSLFKLQHGRSEGAYVHFLQTLHHVACQHLYLSSLFPLSLSLFVPSSSTRRSAPQQVLSLTTIPSTSMKQGSTVVK